MKEIVTDDSGLERHRTWFCECLRYFINHGDQGLEHAFNIPSKWWEKERHERRDLALTELAKITTGKTRTAKALKIEQKLNRYLHGRWRFDGMRKRCEGCGQERQLMFNVLTNNDGNVLGCMRIQQILKKHQIENGNSDAFSESVLIINMRQGKH